MLDGHLLLFEQLEGREVLGFQSFDFFWVHSYLNIIYVLISKHTLSQLPLSNDPMVESTTIIKTICSRYYHNWFAKDLNF